MAVNKCCITGFQWGGTPTGTESKLANNPTYVAGSNPDVAVLLVADLFGWKFPNLRLLADHYAKEINATVYLPDFFGGVTMSYDLISEERFAELDMEGFSKNNSREVREPELFECARALRKQYKRVGAVGYCYGGWACLRLGAESSKTEDGQPLVDAIAIGHPSITKPSDYVENRAPALVLAPEHDFQYTKELKQLTFDEFQKNKVLFSYQHFPELSHAFCVRGSTKVKGERRGMVLAKNAVVSWFLQHLGEEDD